MVESHRKLTGEDRAHLLARAAGRHMTGALTATDIIVIEGHVMLGADGVHGIKPAMLRPRSIEELVAAVGPNDADLEATSTSRRRQRDRLDQLARRAHDPALPRIAHVVLQGVLGGVLSTKDLAKAAIAPYVAKLLDLVTIWQWLFPTIIVRAGSTMTFTGSNVHALVAHRLVVEPNARIVVDRAPVSIDCRYLEIP